MPNVEEKEDVKVKPPDDGGGVHLVLAAGKTGDVPSTIEDGVQVQDKSPDSKARQGKVDKVNSRSVEAIEELVRVEIPSYHI